MKEYNPKKLELQSLKDFGLEDEAHFLFRDRVLEFAGKYCLEPYVFRTNMATSIAFKFFKGKKDLAGEDYILHLFKVSLMSDNKDDYRYGIVGLLHDILEDIPCFNEEVLRGLFGDTITDSIVAITKKQNETYPTYIKRVSKNKMARAVKINDLKHNMDLSRLKKVTKRDLDRVEKYKKALTFLTENND